MAYALNIMMTTLLFVNVSEEVIDAVYENSNKKSKKDAIEVGGILFKRET